MTRYRILEKLKGYGIGGSLLLWLKSFLLGKFQTVVLNESVSQWSGVTSGVPQGSILGSLHFLLYINDIAEAIQSELGVFADDTKIFSITRSIRDVTKLQRDLINMQEWNGIWLLNLNLEKCKGMHIGKNTGANYTMETLGSTVELTKKDFEKDLGVWVTSSLKPSLHCDKTAAAATRILGMLKRTFTKFSKELFIFLYKTSVRPQLEYCVQLWCPYLAQDINTLENVQRQVTKLVNELVKLPYESRLRKLRLYSLYCRQQRGDLIGFYTVIMMSTGQGTLL